MRTSLPDIFQVPNLPVRPAQQLKRDLITPMRDRLTTDLKWPYLGFCMFERECRFNSHLPSLSLPPPRCLSRATNKPTPPTSPLLWTCGFTLVLTQMMFKSSSILRRVSYQGQWGCKSWLWLAYLWIPSSHWTRKIWLLSHRLWHLSRSIFSVQTTRQGPSRFAWQ